LKQRFIFEKVLYARKKIQINYY